MRRGKGRKGRRWQSEHRTRCRNNVSSLVSFRIMLSLLEISMFAVHLHTGLPWDSIRYPLAFQKGKSVTMQRGQPRRL